jgi:hypothetical protein
MKILSIDVGMKCLAYCLFSLDGDKCTIDKWGILDLCNEKKYKCCGINKKNKQPCEKNSKFYKNNQYYCKIHAKKQELKMPANELKRTCIMKAKLGELKCLCEKYDFIKENSKKKLKKTEYQNIILSELDKHYLEFLSTVKTSSINMVTYGKRMKQGFENLLKDIKIDHVIVENQIGPLALRMKTLQGMIMQHFIEKDCETIEEISAANKLKDYLTKKKTKYSERKKLSIEITKKKLEEKNELHNWITHFIQHKKKDDLADSFLQGLWYIKYKL